MKKSKQAVTSTGVTVRENPLGMRIWNCRGYYLMFLPVFIFVIIMNYWPMLGIRYAFYDYKPVGRRPGSGWGILRRCFPRRLFGQRFGTLWN